MAKLFELDGVRYRRIEDANLSAAQKSKIRAEGVNNFLEGEASFWSRFSDCNEFLDPRFPMARNSLSDLFALDKFKNDHLEGPQLSKRDADQMREEVFNFYHHTHLPLSNSRIANLFIGTFHTDRALAYSCLEVWLGSFAGLHNAAGYGHLSREMEKNVARLLLVFGCIKEEKDNEEVEKGDGFKNLNANVVGQLEHLKNEISELNAKWEKHKLDEEESLSNACDQLKEEGNSLVADFTSKLEAMETAWKTNAEIDDSVNYWKDKAGEHQKKSALFGWMAAVYFVSVLAVISVLFWYLPEMLKGISKEKFNFHAYVVQVALGFAASTLVFWVGRILTRLFLSEHHLRIDADERLVMTKTFLAFTAEGKVDEALLPLLLAPLFRPTADGIVKDDAAPVLSLPAFFSKTGMPN